MQNTNKTTVIQFNKKRQIGIKNKYSQKNQIITNKEQTPKDELTSQINRSSPATAQKTCSAPASAPDRRVRHHNSPGMISSRLHVLHHHLQSLPLITCGDWSGIYDTWLMFDFGKCTGSYKQYKTVRTEYRTLGELVLFGKLFQQIGVWCVKISVNMSRCINYLCKKKENHGREMKCKNKQRTCWPS